MLVSAAIADGPPRRVLELIGAGTAELVLPEPVIDELRAVLGSKLMISASEIAAIERLLRELAPELAAAPAEIPAVSGDADDDRILAAALAAGADVLVSGDTRHLLPLREHDGMRIVKPQTFLVEVLA